MVLTSVPARQYDAAEQPFNKDNKMLTVRLATTPDFQTGRATPQALGNVQVHLETLPSFGSRGPGAYLGQFSMPIPGRVMSDGLGPSTPTFVMRVVLQCGPDRAAFVVGPIADDDVLSIFGGQAPAPGGGGTPDSLYTGTIVHANAQDPNPCRVRCDAGPVTADDCCIVCKAGATTVKFCC